MFNVAVMKGCASMTKEDILNMKTSCEVMHTLITDSKLWDDEVNEYVKRLKRKENLEEYGSEDFLPTPIKRKADK